jgi:uncharacterized protein (TIGR00299 family) protein
VTRVAWFDGASGASGDMILGALVDLGMPLEWLRAELARLPLHGYRVEAERVRRGGLLATRVEVVLDSVPEHGHGESDVPSREEGSGQTRLSAQEPGATKKTSSDAHDHSHMVSAEMHQDGHGIEPYPRSQYAHEYSAGEHVPCDAHGHSHPHVHPHHRGLSQILDLLEESTLDPVTKDRASTLFRRLAEVEAGAHGIPIEQVHFHEVGAVDSIVDTVGGVLGLRWLGVNRFVASPLNVGTGTVKTAHGVLPVPAPATTALVHGVPIYGDGEGELLTPTGALLITGHAQAYGPMPAMRIERVGSGAGSREQVGRPNVFRIVVGEQTAPAASDTVLVLQCEIDDLSPQLFGPLVDRLLMAGALDAYLTPVQMKKGRPGILVTVLVPPPGRVTVEEVLFRETTTLGVRWQEWNRTVLDRETIVVETEYGPIRVKLGRKDGVVVNAQPEFEDCQHAATTAGIAVKEAWVAALAAHRKTQEREPR